MSFALFPFASGRIQKQAVHEIVSCNAYTERFGLILTPAQAVELVETRSHALRDHGRIEFGGGAINKIIAAFCDSPYLFAQNYAPTLHELIEIFYAYKNETMDLICDDDLIAFMKSSFDGVCQGSLELLAGRELYRLAKNLRLGLPPDDSEDSPENQEDEEDEPF